MISVNFKLGKKNGIKIALYLWYSKGKQTENKIHEKGGKKNVKDRHQ